MLRAGPRRAHGFRLAGIGFCVAAAIGGAGAAESIDAVTTPGTGKFIACRNWLVTHSCTTYGRVTLPGRIAVGDQIPLTYGSNPKHYIFRVARLRQHGDNCTILSEASGPNEEGEKIEVAPCRAAKPE